MIWTDRARRSVVIGCSRCPSWRELATSDSEAERVARRHLEQHERDDEQRRDVKASQARERRRDTR